MDSYVNRDWTLEKALTTEWLDSNRYGSYAAGSLLAPTRKYHALLVAVLPERQQKQLLLSAIEDNLVVHNRCFPLSSLIFGEKLPESLLEALVEFSFTTFPHWVFIYDKIIITKELLLSTTEDRLLVHYQFEGDLADASLELRPLFANRSFHELQHANDAVNKEIKFIPHGFSYTEYPGFPELFCEVSEEHSVDSASYWYYGVTYPEERARGYLENEDLYAPARLIIPLHKNELWFSVGLRKTEQNLANQWQVELKKRTERFTPKANLLDMEARLDRAAERFIITDHEAREHSIIAGYPWFMEWGRDALIALPGLTLVRGKSKTALKILKKFAAREKQGLIPNYLGNTPKDNVYNTVDASLWFGLAVQRYLEYSHDLNSIVRYFWSTLRNIYQAYSRGTQYGIGVHASGLVYSGNSETNLTWMDAMVDGKPVTPRYGAAVEINALWFNFLGFFIKIAEFLGDSFLVKQLQFDQSRFLAVFNQYFWDSDRGYLADCVNENGKDYSLRPNQLLAVALPFSPLNYEQMSKIVESVTQELLTPYGLRTLSPHDEKYRGTYGGNQRDRDLAYHNGTIWPWLIGFYVDAALKVESKDSLKKRLNPIFTTLLDSLNYCGIDGIAEVFSGDEPQLANGCINQAWSVAELIRAQQLLQE